MTRESSFKTNLKNAFAVFKWEMKNRATSLYVYAILAGVLTVVTLTLSLSIGYQADGLEGMFKSVTVFQLVASFGVFSLTTIFTIVYTAGNYSYLHNKRKVDMYGSLPISPRVLYLSKTAAAYLFSIVPTLFFFGLISMASVIFGQPLVTETIELYLHVIVGTAACISFYGLLAVCCGTTAYTIISFLAICVSYPMAAGFVRALIKSFFYGLPAGFSKDHFLLNALNPVESYQGRNVIYWIIFTAACLTAGTLLAKKRRSDRAQNSFAYFMPVYIVKLIVSFIAGMLTGVLFGTINVLNNGFLGFVFGFLLGSVPTYLIVHLIYYKGFDRVVKTSIPFAAMTAVVFAAVFLMDVDILGYNSYVPPADAVESAGFVYPSDVFDGTKSIGEIAGECTDDIKDENMIKTVTEIHAATLNDIELNSSKKFSYVWYHMMLDSVEEFFGGDDSYCIGYKLKNGTTIERYYRGHIFPVIGRGNDENLDSLIEEVTGSDEYSGNYFSIANIPRDCFKSLTLTDREYAPEHTARLDSNLSDAENAAIDKLYDAMKKDKVRLDRNPVTGGDDNRYVFAKLTYQTPDRVRASRLLHTLMGVDDNHSTDILITRDCANTINALKEIGVMNSDGAFNTGSDYYIRGY